MEGNRKQSFFMERIYQNIINSKNLQLWQKQTSQD